MYMIMQICACMFTPILILENTHSLIYTHTHRWRPSFAHVVVVDDPDVCKEGGKPDHHEEEQNWYLHKCGQKTSIKDDFC